MNCVVFDPELVGVAKILDVEGTLADLQRLVYGSIEFVPCKFEGVTVYVNEESLVNRSLPPVVRMPNWAARLVSDDHGVLLGPIVMVGDAGGEPCSVPPHVYVSLEQSEVAVVPW